MVRHAALKRQRLSGGANEPINLHMAEALPVFGFSIRNRPNCAFFDANKLSVPIVAFSDWLCRSYYFPPKIFCPCNILSNVLPLLCLGFLKDYLVK